MSNMEARQLPYEIIEAEKAAYLNKLPPPSSDWPTDVSEVYRAINENMFDLNLSIVILINSMNSCNNTTYSKFKYYVGYSMRDYVRLNRIKFSCILLKKN